MKKINKIAKNKVVSGQFKTPEQLKKMWDKWFKLPFESGVAPAPISKDDFSQTKQVLTDIQVESISQEDPTIMGQVMFLQQQIPQPISTSFLGVEDIEPNDFEKFRFTETMSVFEDPDYIYTSSRHNSLSNYVIDAMVNIYPEYLEMHRGAVLELLIDYRSNPAKAPNISLNKQKNIAKMFQVAIFNAQTLQLLQSTYSEQQESSPKKSSNVEIGTNVMTNSQRVSQSPQ